MKLPPCAWPLNVGLLLTVLPPSFSQSSTSSFILLVHSPVSSFTHSIYFFPSPSPCLISHAHPFTPGSFNILHLGFLPPLYHSYHRLHKYQSYFGYQIAEATVYRPYYKIHITEWSFYSLLSLAAHHLPKWVVPLSTAGPPFTIRQRLSSPASAPDTYPCPCPWATKTKSAVLRTGSYAHGWLWTWSLARVIPSPSLLVCCWHSRSSFNTELCSRPPWGSPSPHQAKLLGSFLFLHASSGRCTHSAGS